MKPEEMEPEEMKTVEDLFALWGALNSFKDVQLHPKFNYFLGKNRNRIKKMVSDYYAMSQPPKEFYQYKDEMNELRQKHCMGDGKLIHYDDLVPEIKEIYIAESKKIEEKYKDAIAEKDKKQDEFVAIQKLPLAKLSLHKVKIDYYPEFNDNGAMETFIKFDLITEG